MISTLRNSVRLVGNLGTEPEVKNFDNNRKMVKLNLSHERKLQEQQRRDRNRNQLAQHCNMGRPGQICRRHAEQRRRSGHRG